MQFHTNEVPVREGVYRLEIELPVAVLASLIENASYEAKPKIQDELSDSPFTVGMFYQTEPGSDGQPLPPNPYSRKALLGDYFEQGFLQANDPSLASSVWFEPGAFSMKLKDDNPLYATHLIMYYVSKEDVSDTPSGSMTFDEEGRVLAQGGDLAGAPILPIFQITFALAKLFLFLAAVWLLFKVGKFFVNLTFKFINSAKNALENVGKTFRAWKERISKSLNDTGVKLKRAIQSATGGIEIGSILWWGAGGFLLYKMFSWLTKKKAKA
jgi:hypothetical protein